MENVSGGAILHRGGDISITPTSTGYEIRRAATEDQAATRWELVATLTSAKAAGRFARDLATRTGRSLWLHFGGNDLIPVPDVPHAAER